jgi:hypothetical protein
MLILPNEWILDYLTPAVNKAPISEAFVKECSIRGHLLLIRRQSNFRTKIFRYSKFQRYNAPIGRFVDLVLRNSQLVQLVEETDILWDEFDLSTVPGDDRYLAEVLHSFPSAVLVTTDQFLRDQLTNLALKAVLFQDDVDAALRAAEILDTSG